jgi:hypothetical protein
VNAKGHARHQTPILDRLLTVALECGHRRHFAPDGQDQ